MHREVGDRWSGSRSLNSLSRLMFIQAEVAQAEECALESFKIAAGGGFNPNALEALVILAEIYTKREMNQQALELALFVLKHASSTKEVKDGAEKLRGELEPQLSHGQKEAAQASVQSMSLDTLAQNLTLQ